MAYIYGFENIHISPKKILEANARLKYPDDKKTQKEYIKALYEWKYEEYYSRTSTVLGYWNKNCKHIFLNLKALKHHEKLLINRFGLNFEEYLIRLITHESMHHLLYLDEDKNACKLWDIISKKLIEYGTV